MNLKIFFVLCFWIFCSFFCFPLIADQIETILNELDRCSEDTFWSHIITLESLGDDAIDPVLAHLKSLGPRGRLGCAKFLCSVGELEEAFDILFLLIQGKSSDSATQIPQEIRIQAAELLASEGDSSIETQLEDLIDKVFAPRIKIALAKALQLSCGNSRGRRELTHLLNSDNPLVKFEASLALAEISNFSQSQFILSRLQREPSLKGRLSRALMKKDKIYRRYEELLSPSRGLPPLPEASSTFRDKILNEIYSKIHEFHITGDEFNAEYMSSAAIEGILDHYDLESYLLSENQLAQSDEATAQAYGLCLGYTHQGNLQILSVLLGSPAYFALLQAGDIITEINGRVTESHPKNKIHAYLMAAQTQQKPLELKIFRTGWSEERFFSLALAPHTLRFWQEDLPEKLAYIRCVELSKENVEAMIHKLKEWKTSNFRGLLLDIRGCASGSMLQMKRFLEGFLEPDQLICWSSTKKGSEVLEKEFKTEEPAFLELKDFPIVLLVDEGTALFGEILAGALKYHKKAIVVGERTRGHALVQQLLPLKSLKNHYIMLTTGYYLFPSRRRIHREFHWSAQGNLQKEGGVVPDSFLNPLPKEKIWYLEEWATLASTEMIRSFVESIPLEEIPSLLAHPTLESLDALHKKTLTSLPLPEFQQPQRKTGLSH
jgi:carboxyl-terminal processing protease